MDFPDAIYDGKTEIKNIIFDWGGVITDLQFNATKEAFRDLGFTIFDDASSRLPMNELFLPFETGKIGPDEFRKGLRKYTTATVSDSQLDKAWCAMLGELPPERWEILGKAQNHFRTFLLSNTNAIHLGYYFGYLQKIYGTNGYTHFFERTYYSHILGLRKPNADIFEYVIKDAGISPIETLFIDDYGENIETARKLGFRTVHLEAPLTLADVFK